MRIGPQRRPLVGIGVGRRGRRVQHAGELQPRIGELRRGDKDCRLYRDDHVGTGRGWRPAVGSGVVCAKRPGIDKHRARRSAWNDCGRQRARGTAVLACHRVARRGRSDPPGLPNMSVIAACLLLLWASPAAAHGGAETLTSYAAWTADPVILVPLYVLAVLFLIGTSRLWRHAGFGRGTQPHQLACFGPGGRFSRWPFCRRFIFFRNNCCPLT